jgi:hypothetical protein
MWTFAESHWVAFFVLAMTALLVVRSIFYQFARALAAWGTHHCGTCACHTEVEGDDEDEPEGVQVSEPGQQLAD